MSVYQLLHLEDNALDAELVRTCLADSEILCVIATVNSHESYQHALQETSPCLVISDYNLPHFNGIQAFQMLQEQDVRIPFILCSGALGESRAVECLKLGMTDFVLKDHLERLVPAVERALRDAAAAAALQERQSEIQDLNRRLQRAIQESHHRTKNNLQVLLALVDMMRLDDNEVSKPEALTRLSRHVRGLSTLHDLLVHQISTPGASLDSISGRLALERLIPTMASLLSPRVLTLDADDVALSLKQLSSLVLLVNELISNAIKHGDGAIHVALKQEGETLIIEVGNEGAGFAPDFDPAQSANTGLSLIESIGTWDLAGKLTYENTETGARVRLLFPKSPERR
jgi:two-component sensor histidine kinase